MKIITQKTDIGVVMDATTITTYRFCIIIAFTKTRAITQVLRVDVDETYSILKIHGTYHLYKE